MSSIDDLDDNQEMAYNVLPMYRYTIIERSDYKWDDKNKLFVDVCAYFDCLFVISALVWGNKKVATTPPNKKGT
jgi:hypothetical protein